MPKQPYVDFKLVKESVSMEQVLQRYGILDQLKRGGNGDSLSGPCPIHNGSNPTQFRVSLSKNCWNCFSDCHCGGNVLDFIAKMEGISIKEAAVILAEWFKLPTEQLRTDEAKGRSIEPRSDRKSHAKIPDATETGVNKPLGFELKDLKPGHPYLTNRGVALETAVDFGVGFCAKGSMSGRIAIPIHNPDGKVVAYAGRWPGDDGWPEDEGKYKLPHGFKKTLELFNFHQARKESPDRPLVVVEGFFGVMNLWQHGLRKVVALMGSSISDAQVDLIRKLTISRSHVIVILDEDDAGREGRELIVPKLASFVFVHAHVFQQEDRQADSMTASEVAALPA